MSSAQEDEMSRITQEQTQLKLEQALEDLKVKHGVKEQEQGQDSFEQAMRNAPAGATGSTVYVPPGKEAVRTRKPKLKRISQETFDEVVMENIDDFEMEPEESIEDAINQFKQQGVDLGNIVKRVGGFSAPCVTNEVLGRIIKEVARLEKVAATAAGTSSLETVKEGEENEDQNAGGGNGENGGILAKAADSLPLTKLVEDIALLRAECGADDENRLIARSKGAAGLLLAIASALANDSENQYVVKAAFGAFPAVIGRAGGERDCFSDHGIETMMSFISKDTTTENVTLLADVFAAFKVVMIKNEPNKDKFWGAEAYAPLYKCVVWCAGQADAADGSASSESIRKLLKESIQCVRLLCSDDDRRDGIAPNTFSRARQMAERKTSKVKHDKTSMLDPLFEAIKNFAADPALTAELCASVKGLSVNDDICRDVAKSGGMSLAVDVFSSHVSDVKVSRNAMQLLKALANNDDNKRLLVQNGAMSLVLMALTQHAAEPKVLEQGLAALSNLELRQPENCTAIAKADGHVVIIACMQQHPDHANVQRSGCLALRNMVVRNAELKPIVLDAGAETVIRAAREKHRICDDVAFAAMRDLGLNMSRASGLDAALARRDAGLVKKDGSSWA